MTQRGFEDYLYGIYGHRNGTANSYIKAIQIIDELFAIEDLFCLKGKSLTSIDDFTLLENIANFINAQQYLYKKGYDSTFFRNINERQRSYPGKGFCSAAINKLMAYYIAEIEDRAWMIVRNTQSAKEISNKLNKYFDLDKEGSDVEVAARQRIGQTYFRKMVLANYERKCCVTGLNVPQTLRASHICAWTSDKENRMNPENGLCLSATYDAAFDKHLISFDDDYRMIVSREIKEYYTNEVTKEYFENFEGKKMILPLFYLPSKKLLEKHRELMVG